MSRKKRAEEVTKQLKEFLGESCSHCEIGRASPECGDLTCSVLPDSLTRDIFYDDPSTFEKDLNKSENHANGVVVTFGNNTSPVHSLLQITCKSRKGLLYDCLRAVKDHNLKDVLYTHGFTAKAAMIIEDLERFLHPAHQSCIAPSRFRSMTKRSG